MTPVKIIANAVGIGALLIIVGWAAMTSFTGEKTSICAERYVSSTRMTYTDESGALLDGASLQARLGWSEWGIAENSRVVADPSSAEGHALEVRLDEGTGSGYQNKGPRGGIGFKWTPFEMSSARSACLSYDVYVPDDFDFASPGTLPGLAIGTDFDPRGQPEAGQEAGAGVRVSWVSNGAVTLMLQRASDEMWKNTQLARTQDGLVRGRWNTIEQEVALDEGKSSGVVRLWLNGHQAAQVKVQTLANDERQGIAGVLADVHYGTVTNQAVAPKQTVLRLSPFSLRWQ